MENILNTESMQAILKFARSNYIPVLLTDTANLLAKNLKQFNPNTVLEIGTAIGYSGTLILNACDCHLTTLEKEETSFNLAKQHFTEFNLSSRVTQMLGDALDLLLELKNKQAKFDFIFLDGPKGQYIKYLPIIKELLNDGGILFADNVFFKRMIFMEGTIPHKKRTIVVNLRKFLEAVKTDVDFKNVNIVDIGDGVLIATYVKEKLWLNY